MCFGAKSNSAAHYCRSQAPGGRHPRRLYALEGLRTSDRRALAASRRNRRASSFGTIKVMRSHPGGIRARSSRWHQNHKLPRDCPAPSAVRERESPSTRTRRARVRKGSCSPGNSPAMRSNSPAVKMPSKRECRPCVEPLTLPATINEPIQSRCAPRDTMERVLGGQVFVHHPLRG